ncbi:MAG: MnhB domain-containing protein [Candidatus Bipolaricaulota bacterium]|jgi:multicomponent Na+:H+ antiporter subunit B
MKALAALSLLVLMGLLAVGVSGVFPRPAVPPAEDVAAEWGAKNVVAAIVLGVRLWDTLFEILVYAMTMVGVKLGLRLLRWEHAIPPVRETPLLRRSADLLLGPIVVFALYVAVSGHLGPGGGFPAGAILGTALLLLALAKGVERLSAEIHEPSLEWAEYGAIVAILAVAGGLLLVGVRGSGYLIAANVLIALEVGIGAWVVLHRFASSRGEV